MSELNSIIPTGFETKKTIAQRIGLAFLTGLSITDNRENLDKLIDLGGR